MKGKKKRKAPLTTRTVHVSGVVTFKDYELYEVWYEQELLNKYLLLNAKEWATAVHDRDFDENGQAESLHIHFLMKLQHIKRLSTVINEISKALDVNPFAVSVDKLDSFEAQFRYLVHKDDPDKFQYEAEIINTNLPKEEIDTILAQEGIKLLDADALIEIVYAATSKRDIMRNIGVYQYRNLRGVINDIWQERLIIEGKAMPKPRKDA